MLALQQMDDRVTVHREWFKDYRFHLLRSDEGLQQLRKLVDICVQRQLCALDLETTGVDNRVYPDEYFGDGRRTKHGIRTVDRIVGICISFDGQNGYYVPLGHDPEDSGNLPWEPVWEEITRLIHGARIIFHNAKFDCEFLYPVTGRERWKVNEFEDSFLLAKTVSPLKSFPAGLKPLTKLLYGVEMVELDELFTDDRKEQLKRNKEGYNFALLHPKEGVEYGCSDGIFTYKVYHTLRERIEGFEKVYELEKNFCNVMRKMERNRVHVDVERVNQLFVDCQKAMRDTGDLVRQIIESKTGKTTRWMTLNVGSPTQLSGCFFTDGEGLKLRPTPEMMQDAEGGFSVTYDDADTDSEDGEDDDGPDRPKVYSLKDEVLKSLHRHYGDKFSVQREGVVDKDGKPKRESMFELILEYRHYDKMNGSYVEKLLKSHDRYGDVRPSFNQVGTDTSRLSCKAGKIEDGYSGVNFQGIPRDSDDDKPELFKQIRTVVIPREGWLLVKIDYAGEELRVITNMSGDPIWKDSFLHKDGDVHSITARILFAQSDVSKDQRNRGKRSNFAIIYGGGAGAISRNVGCSIEDGGRHMENMRSGLPVLMGYVDHQKKFAKKHKCIFTAFGRKMPIPTIDSPIKQIQRKAERCAINYTIQATSADILKIAMCYVDKKIRELGWEDRVRYVLTVHDEVVFEIRPQHLMEVIRKLDEWMVLPWMLPKLHGRQWEVPLETEPGIDIHWRARYDYFAMVDGKPADKKDVDAEGNFKGKLKKDQYFADGRVYQKVPDFLKDYIRRLTPAESDAIKAAQREGKEWTTPPAPEPAPPPPPEAKKEPVLDKQFEGLPIVGRCVVCGLTQYMSAGGTICANGHGGVDTEDPVEERTAKSAKEEGKGNGHGTLALDVGSRPEAREDRPPQDAVVSAPKPPREVVVSGESGELSIDDALPPPPSSKPAAAAAPERPSSAPERRPVEEGEAVLRWTFTARPSEEAMDKLQAICILAKGGVPLRIVSPKGGVIVPEDKAPRVDPVKFRMLASLFGLG